MKRILSDDQFETFTVLLRSDIDRLNEMIESDDFDDEDVQDMIIERDRLVRMCEHLGVEST